MRLAIYELNHSLRAWFEKLCGLIYAFGFTSCIDDHIVITRKTKGHLVILTVHLDDMFLTGSDNTSIHSTKTCILLATSDNTSSTLIFMIWKVQDTFLGLSL